MKAFISSSVLPSDEFILILLSFMLKEDNIDVVLSQNDLESDLDESTKKSIEESSIYIGIVLDSGAQEARVLAELQYATDVKIPSVVIVEDKITNKEILKSNALIINRTDVQKSIYEIERNFNNAKAAPEKSADLIAWILSSKSIISTLNSAFQSSKQGNSKYVTSGRLKLIEQQLLSIDSATFQNLCDVYLAFREQELASINRTGSQLGKQKTVKGTPDTFFRLADGSLRYVEYTTKAEGLVAKIQEDIDKCLDQDKTGIPAEEVSKIIICFNSRLDVSEETSITKYAKSKNIRIELIGLDWLALEIYSKYLILAKDILGIPLDTGQLLPLQNFVDEYNNKAGKLSTPLDNIFLHRKSELAEIGNILNTNDLLIISGFPGVGKTKIALEALTTFLENNKSYSAYAISKKDQDISEDLKIHLQQEKDYILLVDDANRQLLNFKQILGIFREKRKGNIKLLITVRDYALNDVINECFEFDPQKIVIKKFTDKEITEIISSDSFEIRNPKYQKRIVEVADGNARLAVMASRIAKQKQEFFLLGDVSDLYDSYFQTFIKDFDIFGDKILLKTLGIISFFYTIDRANKGFIDIVLKAFELDYHDFNEAIAELEKRELIEVQYNNARVSEQVMATYFFYKAFIKDEILSFKTLLFTFFPDWLKRFSDTIIPSNNSFGYDNVLKKINDPLNDYLQSIEENEKSTLAFFTLFWFYKRDEMLSYFHSKIKNLPEPEKPTYSATYETNDFIYNKDETLDYLSYLFSHDSDSFIPALELAFEYCRKKPESLGELIKKIREKLLFDEEDQRSDFARQVKLFNLIISKFNDKQPHYIKAFFALARTFLSHYYQITKGGRNHSITFYQYPTPFNETIKEFRKKIWTSLFDNYEVYPKEVFSVVENFRPGFRETIIEILDYDLLYLVPFIESKLNAASFEHIHFVNNLVGWLDSQKLTDRTYQKLKTKFTSIEYDFFKKLDWNRFRGKQDYQFEKYEDFEKLKEQDIRSSFIFKSSDEFSLLHKVIKDILSIEKNGGWDVNKSLDIIVEENFIRNNEIGFLLLESVFKNYHEGLNQLYKTIRIIITQSPEYAKKLWELIKTWDHHYKIYWQLNFFGHLPKEFVDEFYGKELLDTISSIEQNCSLFFEAFEKFEVVDKDIFIKILTIAVDKIENKSLKIDLWNLFDEKYLSRFSSNFELLKKAYIQQEKANRHFDFNRDGLKTLTRVHPEFLLEYVTLFYANKENSHLADTHNKLQFAWDLDKSSELIEGIANIIIENTLYFGISEHPLVIFFHQLDDEQMDKAKKFILGYITKYSTDRNKMNSIFDVIRNSMTDFFQEAFLHYLSTNSNIEDFKHIYWSGNGGVYSGDVIIGEIQAKDWQNILNMVGNFKNQIDIIPIKAYIKKQIEYELKSGEEERKRRFINPDGW